MVLTKAELDDRLPDQLDDQRSAAERSQFIEDWVSQELLYQEATERDVHRNALVYHLIEQARRDLVVAAFLDSVFGNRPSDISDKELSAYYGENKKNFEELFDLYAAGKINPEIADRFSLKDSAQAIAHLKDRKAKGKVIIDV